MVNLNEHQLVFLKKDHMKLMKAHLPIFNLMLA
jgi:hypothetical protein